MTWNKRDDIESLLAELALSNFQAESLHWVDVVHVVTPLDFYLRPVKYNKLVESYKKINPTTKYTTININDMVMYNLSHFNGQRDYFTRGRVSEINIDNDHVKCDIYNIDHGYTDKSVPLEHLWHCSPDLLNTPALAYNSKLANCYPVGSNTWTAQATRVFRHHLGHGRVKMTVLGRTSSKLVVKLMNTNLEDVATLLAISGYSDIGSYYDCIPWKPLMIRKRFTFKFKKVQVNKKLRVRMLSGRSFEEFYVKEVKDYVQFLKDVDNISFYARREFSLIYPHMIEGAIICARDDENNTYHRAIIKKVTKLGSTAILQLVDWGRDEEFSVDKMKYMSKQAMTSPLTTIFCKTTNPENHAWDIDLESFLTPGIEFYITIKRLGYEFECPHTVEISPIENEICQGATALPEETEQNTNIETEDEICEGASSCVGNTLKRKPFGYGHFEYLSTPDISPHSEEEDDGQGTITWQKLSTRRRVPFKGVNFKFLAPQKVKYRSPTYESSDGSAADENFDFGNEEYESEYSNTKPNITRRRRLANDIPKDYKIKRSPAISEENETTEEENTVEESKTVENLDLNFKCLNLENKTKESGEKNIKSDEHTYLENENTDYDTE